MSDNITPLSKEIAQVIMNRIVLKRITPSGVDDYKNIMSEIESSMTEILVSIDNHFCDEQ
jgi:hypothetical protein